MKSLWAHNFDPENPVSGVFMYQMHRHLELSYGSDVSIDTRYLGRLSNPFCVLYQLLWMVFRSKSYDIVHAQFGSVCGWICSFSRSRLRVITLRGSDWYINSEVPVSRSIHGRLQRFFTMRSLNRYHLIFATSNRMKREIKSKFPGANVVTFPSPVDPDVFCPADKASSKQVLGLDPASKYFLYPVASETNPIKRPWLINGLRESLPSNIKIITASGVPHSKMPVLYNAVEAVLLPSVYEGWPNVIKEALLCDTPFIATDVSDLAEIAEPGALCFVVEPTVHAFYEVIIGNDFSKCSGLREQVLWMNLDSLCSKLLEFYR